MDNFLFNVFASLTASLIFCIGTILYKKVKNHSGMSGFEFSFKFNFKFKRNK